jgi:hypothetical protein
MKIVPEIGNTCKTPIMYIHQKRVLSRTRSLTLVAISVSSLLRGNEIARF